jgi:hypothetical protein
MSNFGTDMYAAQRIVRYRTEERLRQADQACTARAFRRVRPEPAGAAPRRVRRGFRFAWAARRAAA